MNGTWDLSVFYRDFDDAQIESDFARINQLMPQMQALLASGRDAVAVMEEYASHEEELQRLFGKLGSFANLTLSTDAGNTQAM